jgi:hypothetical protein
MASIGEKDAHYKEALIKLLKILEKIKNQVLQQ